MFRQNRKKIRKTQSLHSIRQSMKMLFKMILDFRTILATIQLNDDRIQIKYYASKYITELLRYR